MIRKIHLVAAATAAVLCAACDTHIDVPDTAVRPGHILCEDGTALPYAQYEQSGKKAIAVVFDTEKRGDTRGTVMQFTCGTLLHRHSPTASALHKAHRLTSWLMMAMRIHSHCMIHKKPLRQWQKRFSTYGGTGRVPMYRPWQRCGCSTPCER